MNSNHPNDQMHIDMLLLQRRGILIVSVQPKQCLQPGMDVNMYAFYFTMQPEVDLATLALFLFTRAEMSRDSFFFSNPGFCGNLG